MTDNRLARWLLLIIGCSFALMPLLSNDGLALLSFGLSLIIWLLVVFRALDGITAWVLALLGFSVFGFFDVFKTLYIDDIHMGEVPEFRNAVYLIYAGVFVFLVSYMLSKPKVVRTVKIRKLKNRPILSSFFIGLVCVYAFIDINSPYVYLSSFLPKAFLLLVAWVGITSKRYWMVGAAMAGMVLVHTEISRRIYIVIFFALLATLLSVIKGEDRQVKLHWKFIVGGLLAAGFLFVNMMRADFDYGEGYVEGDEVESTINYMKKAKAVDVFQNTEFVVRTYPNTAPYLYGQSYAAIFVQFIPRSLWKDKWVGFGAPLALARQLGVYEFDSEIWQTMLGGFSYSTGFWGEAFANFGLLGVLFMSFLAGYVAKYFDGLMRTVEANRNPMSLCVLVFYGAFFLIARGDMLMATYFSILYSLFTYIVIRAYAINIR